MSRTAVVAGVGPNLGAAIARKLADEGCAVGLFARSESHIEELESELRTGGADALAVPTDITDPEAVERGFERVREAFGPVDVLINHAGGGSWQGVRSISAKSFEDAWRVGALGGLLCSKEAIEDMLAADGGTIVFTGATSSIRGREGALGFSSAKFAVRGMAESMARELGPEGIHVAHVVIDGHVQRRSPPDAPDRGDVETLHPEAIADSYWHLVEQDRSAWTFELDLRPHTEEF